jgi:hypothetical protein
MLRSIFKPAVARDLGLDGWYDLGPDAQHRSRWPGSRHGATWRCLMGKGFRRREAREQKYMPSAPPKKMIVARGKVREVYPDPRISKHGREPEKYEPEDRWQ